jgi:hypothetical protein
MKLAGLRTASVREVARAKCCINKEIDKRYRLHADQLATRNDLAAAKTEIIKWTVGTLYAAVAMFATITQLFP